MSSPAPSSPFVQLASACSDWKEAEFDETIVANVERAGYPRPRNFQRYALPIIFQGHDLMGQAETGAGKSVAFLLPIIQKLNDEFKGHNRMERLHRCAALVIEPTRELAIQLFEQAKKLTVGECRLLLLARSFICWLVAGTDVTVNVAYGEYKTSVNRERIHLEGCDILIGTPGRLYAFLSEKFVSCRLRLAIRLD